MSKENRWVRYVLYLGIGISLLLSASFYLRENAVAQTGEVSIHLHLDRTTVLVGEEIQVSLSIANSISKPQMKVRLILKVPPGMSVSSTEQLEAGAGQYIGTYEVDIGKLRHIGLVLHPNQPGLFLVEGDLEWYFGEDIEASKTKAQTFPVTVASAVTPPRSSRSVVAALPSWLWPIVIVALIGLLALITVNAAVSKQRGSTERSRQDKKVTAVILPVLIVIVVVVAVLLVWVWQQTPGTTTSELTASVSPPGTGMVSPSSGIYATGTVVSLLATPAEGYRFEKWTGSVQTIANADAGSTTIRLNKNHFIIANFRNIEEPAPTPAPTPPSETPAQYSLTVSSTAGGSVTTPGEGIFPYEAGTVVSLKATPTSGYRFVGWTGNADTIANVNAVLTTITMDDNYSVVANFLKTDEPVVVTRPPVRYDLVISSTAGGSVTTPGEGIFQYNADTVVSLVATPAEGYEFVTWTGDVDTIANVRAGVTTITLRTSYSVAANFKKKEGVYFGDPNLEEAVRKAIGIPIGSVYPADLRGLTSLSAVDRNINSLIGLEYCTDLTSLDLSNNKISDISPIGSLTKLTRLTLWDNQISDISPLANLKNLTHLYLEWNLIATISPLRNLISLRELGLGSNQISDVSPLANLTNLTTLNLCGNQISNLSALASLSSLTILSISANAISDLSALASLTNLAQLNLAENRIGNVAPLANLTNLTRLWLASNQISDISPLINLIKLEVLDLGNNQITEISALVNNPGLGKGDELVLTNNPLSSDSLNTHIPQLQARGVAVCY